MNTTKGVARRKTQAKRIAERSERREFLVALAAAAVVPVSSCGGAAGTPDEALEETYKALASGAGSWDPADVKNDYIGALRRDFEVNFSASWAKNGPKVKAAAAASGVLAALIAQGSGATGKKLSKQHVFMGSAIVQASKACRPDDDKQGPRGVFCAYANFGSAADALETLLKTWPPK